MVVASATRRSKSRFAAALVMVLLVSAAGVGFAAPSGAATTTVLRGTVQCTNGHKVVGVYVTSQAGGSNFAGWWPHPTNASAAYYSIRVTASSTNQVKVAVGCGRNSTNWGSSNQSAWRATKDRATYDLNLLCPEPADGAGTTTASGSCRGALKGAYPYDTISFSSSQCTFEASLQWYNATGNRPNFLKPGDANAHRWDDWAAASGWDVRSVPAPRSIMVWNPTSGLGSVGHVAWVRDLRRVKDSAGNYQIDVYVTQRNLPTGTGTTTGWMRFNPGKGIRFILAP